MKISADDQKDELKEELNEMENLFSELIIELDQINDKIVEDAKIKDLQNNIDEKEIKDILNQREVEDNIKDIKQNYSKDINRRHHYTIA